LDNYQIAVRDWWQSLPLSTLHKASLAGAHFE
jgi:hypothetical protein